MATRNSDPQRRGLFSNRFYPQILLRNHNPKDAAYGSTPLVYAAGSAIMALAFNRASAWAARRKMIEGVKAAALRDPLAP